MTLLTVGSNIERILAIMAESARSPFFHVKHGSSLVDFRGEKCFVVAVIAPIQARMELVAEERPGIPESNLFNRVTLVA